MKFNIEHIKIFNEIGRNELQSALEEAISIKEVMEVELKERYDDDDLLDRIIRLERIIKDAKAILNCEFGDFEALYKRRYPDYVDENGKINEKGLKRFKVLKKRWENLGYLQKKS